MAAIYDLIDITTGEVVGQVTTDGRVTSSQADILWRVTAAFGRELLVRDGEVVDELGICFADVETVLPDDPRHANLVMTHLAGLTGLLPRPRE